METWGCQMNVLDGRRFVGLLGREGIVEASTPEDADVVLLNTCSVRDKAEQKVYDRIGRLAKLKRERPGTVIGVCGCVAQQEGEGLLERLPHVDFVLGTGRIEALPSVLRRVEEEGDRPCETGFDPDEVVYTPGAVAHAVPHRAAITVIEGCNKNCTFCVVPRTRGRERNRRLRDVVDEARSLVEAGAIEIELLGQTVNAFRDPGDGRGSRGPPARGRCPAGNPAPALRDVPPPQFLRPAHRGDGRDTRGRSGPSSARAVRLRRGAAPHETPVHAGGVSRPRGVSSCRHPRPRAFDRRHRGLSGRDGRRLRRNALAARRGAVRRRFLLLRTRRARRPPRSGGSTTSRHEEASFAPRAARGRFQQEIQRQLNRELEGRTLEVLVEGLDSKRRISSGRSRCNRVVNIAGESALRPGTFVNVQIERGFPNSLLGKRQEAEREQEPQMGRDEDSANGGLCSGQALPDRAAFQPSGNVL